MGMVGTKRWRLLPPRQLKHRRFCRPCLPLAECGNGGAGRTTLLSERTNNLCFPKRVPAFQALVFVPLVGFIGKHQRSRLPSPVSRPRPNTSSYQSPRSSGPCPRPRPWRRRLGSRRGPWLGSPGARASRPARTPSCRPLLEALPDPLLLQICVLLEPLTETINLAQATPGVAIGKEGRREGRREGGREGGEKTKISMGKRQEETRKERKKRGREGD